MAGFIFHRNHVVESILPYRPSARRKLEEELVCDGQRSPLQSRCHGEIQGCTTWGLCALGLTRACVAWETWSRQGTRHWHGHL
jgi:hypothetical protein